MPTLVLGTASTNVHRSGSHQWATLSARKSHSSCGVAEAPGRSVELRGTVSAGSRALAGAVNGLLEQRRSLSQEMAQRVAEARQVVEA